MASSHDHSIIGSAEQDAIRSEAMDFAGIGTYRYRMDGSIVYMDHGALRILDIEASYPDPAKLVGKNISDLIVYDGPKGQLRAEILKRGHIRNYEYRFTTLSGKRRVAIHDSYLVPGDQADEQAIQVIVRDITARKETEDALQSERERLAVTLFSIGDGVIVTDREGHVTLVNKVAELLTGWSTNEAAGRPVAEVFPIVNARTRTPADDPVERALREGEIVGLANDTLLIGRDGAEYLIADSCAPILNADGNAIGTVLVFRDITDEYRQREIIRKSEQEKALILDNTSEIIALHDKNQRLIWANRAYVESVAAITGMPACLDDMVGRSCHTLWGLEETCNLCPVRRTMETGQPEESELNPENQAHWPASQGSWLIRAAPARNAAGEVVGAIEVAIDVTAKRRAEHDYQRLFHEMFDGFAIHEMIFDVAGNPADYRFLAVNPAFERLTGLDAEKVMGRTVREILPGTEHHWIETYGRVVRTGKPILFEQYSAELGKHFQVSAYRCAPGQFACLFMDVTDRKRAEESNRRIANLESLGTIAGGIAHDFNNLLMGVFGSIELAIGDIPATHPARAPLRSAYKALDQARYLASRLLTFASGGEPVLEIVDLRQRICDTVQFLLTGSTIAVRFDIPADLWPVKADSGQFADLIANLTLNAKEAMPSGGTLYIQARNVPDIRDPAMPELRGPYVKLVLKDEGYGIPQHVIGRIFDPYFTTKQTGNGLGLAIVHGIVRKHGGHIMVDSVPSVGSTFTILLPAETEASPTTAPELPLHDPTPRRCRAGHILVMDDELIILTVTSRMLEQLGHTVATVRDGREAIEKFTVALQAGKPFDVVIMDLTVPGGMGGKDAINEILAVQPAAKVIVSSGYSSDQVLADYATYGFSGYLAKPFALRELDETISAIL